MQNIERILAESAQKAIAELYTKSIELADIVIQPTRKEFEGDFTILVFPFVAHSKKKPDETANEIGAFIKNDLKEVEAFNSIKGFLNISITKSYWLDFLKLISTDKEYGFVQPAKEAPTVMIEYSCPNSNKPLHLGHVRNNLIGFSISRIVKAACNNVIKVNLINDRGIHICKSMLAWKKWGENETPASSGLKGDFFVGKYYVLFDKKYKEELKTLIGQGLSEEEADKKSLLMEEAHEMLRLWESGDSEVIQLWEMMNSWVYEGFNQTYKAMGVDFDKVYYESETYLMGKEIVDDGLMKEIFYRRTDHSVWVDLTHDGLDEKLVLRSDGTSVYITQDLGTAYLRSQDFKFDKLVYVVANEQEYHFKVLFLILKKLGYTWANGCYHLSYGMVELPEGKMKSREGTVVDADDLMQEMVDTAREISKELGKIENFESEEAEALYKTIGMGALKYFILKVDPKKKMLFNPRESVDFEGNTGPFIQYTYARICSLLRKAKEMGFEASIGVTDMSGKEKDLVRKIVKFPAIVKESANGYNPALVANYTYDIVKEYNQFYHDYPVLKEENQEQRSFRIALSQQVGQVIKNAFWLLGIDVPERM